jgi:hypothetical protein
MPQRRTPGDDDPMWLGGDVPGERTTHYFARGPREGATRPNRAVDAPQPEGTEADYAGPGLSPADLAALGEAFKTSEFYRTITENLPPAWGQQWELMSGAATLPPGQLHLTDTQIDHYMEILQNEGPESANHFAAKSRQENWDAAGGNLPPRYRAPKPSPRSEKGYGGPRLHGAKG